jgi:GTPase SAR1 family protein
LEIWDTCGQEQYRSLIKSFFSNSSLAIIAYAIDDKKSFNSIDEWVRQCKTSCSPDTKFFLIGNKADLIEE